MYAPRPVLDRRAFLDRVRYPSFDGLRALSILPVVFHHATPRPLEGALGRGPLGVDLFFAISGFLITTLLLREREATGTVRLGAFFARRALRIFPLYYAVLGLFVVHALFLREPGPVRDHFLRSLPVHVTYTSNWLLDTNVPHAIVFGFGWSLATEEQFYAVWPLVVRWAKDLRVAAAFMFALLVVDQLAEHGVLGLEGLSLRVVRSIATPICGGALVALASRTRAGFALLASVLGHRPSALVALGVLVLTAAYGWSLALAHLSMVALVASCALRPDHVLAPLLDSAPLRYVGVVSYGIYLLNVPAVVAVKRALGEGASVWVVFACALTLSLVLASIAHRVLEKPLLAARERLRTRARPS